MTELFNIAIVGSREYPDKKAVYDKVDELNAIYPESWKLITGGANGPDKWAEMRAKETGVKVRIIRPAFDYQKYGKLELFYRTVEVITIASHIYAFWDGKSHGTAFTIEYANARKKHIDIISPNGKTERLNYTPEEF